MDSISYRQKIQGDWDAFSAVNAFAHAFNQDKHTAELEIDDIEPG